MSTLFRYTVKLEYLKHFTVMKRMRLSDENKIATAT